MSEGNAIPVTVLVIGGLGLLDLLAAAFLAWAPVAQGWGFGEPVTVAGWQTTMGGFSGTFLGICGATLVGYAAYMRRKLLAPGRGK